MPTTLSKRLAVVASAFSADPREAALRAHASGFAGVLFDAYSRAVSPPEFSASGQREFLSVLRANDVQLVGLQGDLGAKGLGPGADVDRVLDRAEAAMKAAADLRAPLVCIDLGPMPEPARESKPRPAIKSEQAGAIIIPSARVEAPLADQPRQPASDPAVASQFHDALSELGHRAERYSCTVALSSALASFAAIDAALRAAACPWFGVDLDPVAILRDDWSGDEIFSALGDEIRHIRVRDAIAGTDRRTKPAIVGQGKTDWPTLLNHLDATGYAGWLTVDPTELPDRNAAAIAARNVIL